jgi:hypothetical protein
MTATSVPLTPISASPQAPKVTAAASPQEPGAEFALLMDQATPQTLERTGDALPPECGRPLPFPGPPGELAPLLPLDWEAYPAPVSTDGAEIEAAPPAEEDTEDPDPELALSVPLTPALGLGAEPVTLPLATELTGTPATAEDQGEGEDSTLLPPGPEPQPRTQGANPVALIASVPGKPELAELVAEARPEGFDPVSGRPLWRRTPVIGQQTPVLAPGLAGEAVPEEGRDAEEWLRQGLEGSREPLAAQQSTTASASEEGAFMQLLHQTRSAAGGLNTTSSPAAEMRQLSLELPLGGRGWDQGLGERLQWLIGRDIQQAEVRLNPQHLGPLEIRVSMQNDQANVTILAQHAQTREAVEASLPRLREMLQEVNVNLGSLDVGQRETASQRQGREGAHPGHGGWGFASEAGEDSLLDPGLALPRLRLQGLVDDFA